MSGDFGGDGDEDTVVTICVGEMDLVVASVFRVIFVAGLKRAFTSRRRFSFSFCGLCFEAASTSACSCTILDANFWLSGKRSALARYYDTHTHKVTLLGAY